MEVNLFTGRMNFGKDTDWMIVVGKHRGFGYMIALFIDIFCGRALGTITNPSKRFKFKTVGFDNIAVVDMDNRLGRTPTQEEMLLLTNKRFSDSISII